MISIRKARRFPCSQRELPPVIVFGGNDNALSLARSLGQRSIPVHILNERQTDVSYSRFARPIRIREDCPFTQAAAEYLLGNGSENLTGSVLLAASDEALETIIDYRSQLSGRFLLDVSNPVAQRQMLDKLSTYRAAEEAKLPLPRFWQVHSLDDLQQLREQFVYPLIVKPKISHIFQRKFKSKFLVAESFSELLEAYQTIIDHHIEVLLVEKIPGPDNRLCSYYTYLDEAGNALFDFTKRIIRRYPKNMGLACYHVTDQVENVRELALRLFRHVGLFGLANAEFKYDIRDGQLKLIECNARFTAANGLLKKAGLDLGSFVYNRIVGLSQEPLPSFRSGLRLWDPLRDLRAFLELRRAGELTTFEWLGSIAHWQTFPAYSTRDPLPSIVRLGKKIRGKSK